MFLSKAVIYWQKDPRYNGSIMIALPISLLTVIGVYKGFIGVESIVIVTIIFAFLIGYSIQADISIDSTAFATQIMCGVNGKTDRFVRPIPYILFFMLFMFIQNCIELYFGNDIDRVILGIIVTWSIYLIVLSVNNFIGSVIIYPIQVPNSSLFEQKGVSNMGLVMLVQFVGMISAFLFATPVIGIFIYNFYDYKIDFNTVITTMAGLFYALIISFVSYYFASKQYDKNKIKFMEKISSWPDHKIKIL